MAQVKPTKTKGTTTNDSAAAGDVGEYVSGALGYLSLANNTAKTVASIPLTAGDWDISSAFTFAGNASTNITATIIAINTVTDTLPNGLDARLWSDARPGGATIYGTLDLYNSTSGLRVSIASAATYYLIAYQNFTVSTSTCSARISARRVR